MSKRLAPSRIHMPSSANSDQPKETIKRDLDERCHRLAARFTSFEPKSIGMHFWHRLAERLDALVAYAIKNAVSEQELRRVDEDIKRCRELMSKNSQQEDDAKLARMRLARGIRMAKIR